MLENQKKQFQARLQNIDNSLKGNITDNLEIDLLEAMDHKLATISRNILMSVANKHPAKCDEL
jgi:hypothetical protein